MKKPIDAARKTYEKNKRQSKLVSFNSETESDIFEYSKKVKPSFSEWTKNLLRLDMEASKNNSE